MGHLTFWPFEAFINKSGGFQMFTCKGHPNEQKIDDGTPFGKKKIPLN